MEKEVREFVIPYTLNWEWSVSLSKIRHDLDELEKLGATHVNIEAGESYGNAYISIQSVCERMETDEEFEIRKESERVRLEGIKEQELAYFNRIKEKYGIS